MELREQIGIIIYIGMPVNYDGAKIDEAHDICNRTADTILLAIRGILEEKMPKGNNMKWKDTYHRDYYKGFNDCLAEICTIIQGIK